MSYAGMKNNNEKSREGIGKDKPVRQPAAINDGIIII
jgi:hypothetical protein